MVYLFVGAKYLRYFTPKFQQTVSVYAKVILVIRMKLTFGEKLRNLRESMNLTQDALGEKLHMTQRKISYLERNKYEPSLDDIREICMFFRLSADYFLDLPKEISHNE